MPAIAILGAFRLGTRGGKLPHILFSRAERRGFQRRFQVRVLGDRAGPDTETDTDTDRGHVTAHVTAHGTAHGAAGDADGSADGTTHAYTHGRSIRRKLRQAGVLSSGADLAFGVRAPACGLLQSLRHTPRLRWHKGRHNLCGRRAMKRQRKPTQSG